MNGRDHLSWTPLQAVRYPLHASQETLERHPPALPHAALTARRPGPHWEKQPVQGKRPAALVMPPWRQLLRKRTKLQPLSNVRGW